MSGLWKIPSREIFAKFLTKNYTLLSLNEDNSLAEGGGGG